MPMLSRCPACLSSRLALNPASRTTDRQVATCRSCGLRCYANYAPPPLAVRPRDEFSADQYDDYVQIKRAHAGPQAWHEGLRRIQEELGRASGCSLYDIGAGDGEFLRLARDGYGFEVCGSEIQQGAADLALSRNGVELEVGDLTDLGHHDRFDAATLWCVLAHTYDGDKLLTATQELLKPGGIMFLQTPRWTSADQAALLLQRASNGRVSRLVDRRVATHHWLLHTKRSITSQLERLGFEVLSVQPKARYSLASSSYLGSLGVPQRIIPAVASTMDGAINHGASFRIVLDVCARKPSALVRP